MAKNQQSAQSRSPARSPAQQAGLLGEAFVAAWWQRQQWTVVAERWHCRWGELDLVVRSPAPDPPNRIHTLAFVEVKTRAQRNWDEDGLLALTPTKQLKLIRTAQTFLGEFPDLANDACRFDVAAIRCDRASGTPQSLPTALNLDPAAIALSSGQRHTLHGHHLTLQHYIPNAFDLSQ